MAKYLCQDDLGEFILDSEMEFPEGEEIQLLKQLGPPVEYPPEPNKPKGFVVQDHFRGATVHGDFRVARNKQIAEGWTLLYERPGMPPVLDIKTAGSVAKDQQWYKISLKTGRILPREVQTTIRGKKRTIVRPGAIRAEMKAEEIPLQWLHIQGRTPLPPLFPETVVKDWLRLLPVSRNELRREGWNLATCKKIISTRAWKEWKKTRNPKALDPIKDLLPAKLLPEPPIGGTQAYPGVFYILDHGTVTHGIKLPWAFEYFFEDSKLFKGRFLFRLVEHSVNKSDVVLPVGEKEVKPRVGTYWILMTPTEPGSLVQPYILSESAREKNVVTPYGVSALPIAFQEAIPKDLRYWKVKDEKRRHDLLNMLRDQWDKKSLDSLKRHVTVIGKAENRFKLLYRSWRGQHVIRFGPSTREWILLLSNSKKVIALINDPSKRDVVAGYTEDLPFDALWEISEAKDIPPNSELNPTKDTPCTIRQVDRGSVKLLDEGEGYFKANFQGDRLKGLYFFREEEPGAGFWEVSHSEGPKIEKLGEQVLEGTFVLQRHELPPDLGEDHWDLRILPEGSQEILEWNLYKDPREHNIIQSAEGKACLDLTWMDISAPQRKKIEGHWTKVIPLDQGKVRLTLRSIAEDVEDMLKETELDLELSGKVLNGMWKATKQDDGLWTFEHEPALKITKADKKKQLVYGIVLAPYEVDSWLDYERPEEIEKAAHVYLVRMWEGKQPAMIGKEHKQPIAAIPVESYIAPVDFWYPGTPKTEEYKVKAGSWVLVTYIKDKTEFNKILKGKYSGYSVQGLGRRKKVSEGELLHEHLA